MAAISTSTFGTGQTVSLAATGQTNLRASHTFMVRLKNGSTSTTIDSVVASYQETSGTFNDSGSAFGRNNGVASTAMNVYRISDAFSPVADAAARSTCYGNTTTWYHLAFVYNASTQQIRFYIDGVFIGQHASNTTRTDSVTSTTYGIAAHPGKYADFAFFSAALTDNEVLRMSQFRVPQVTSNLQVFWRLDSNATDTSGNGRNGAASGGAPNITWSTSDNPPQPEIPTAGGSASTSGTATVTKTFTTGLCTGSASTSGSAAVTRTFTVSPCTGSASTSGTATVGISNVVAAGTPKNAGWADLMPRNGAESYRYIQTFLNNASANGAATGGAANRTFMCWMRYYFKNVSAAQTYLGSAYIYLRGTGGATWRMSLTASSDTTGPYFSGSCHSGGSQIGLRSSSILDCNWHHCCVVSNGSAVEFYLDGVQQGSDITAAIAGDDTATSVVVASDRTNYPVPVDIAHAKAWIGSALNGTQIAAEMASYRPVTDTSNVRGYWPLAWDNPRWDAWSNTMTLPSQMVAVGEDDGPNGPSGSWPPIGSVAGSTQTSGTASVMRVVGLGACTGAASTSGTAAVTASAAIVATGSNTTSVSSAAITRSVVVTASTQTTGSAAVVALYAASASSSTQTSATANLTANYAVAPAGQTQTTGAADVEYSLTTHGDGVSQTAGTADMTLLMVLSASGSTSTSGTASVTSGITYAIAATGQASTSGSAVITASAGISASGQASTGAVAGFAGTVIPTGQTQTAGTAFFGTALFPVAATGTAATTGSAAVTGNLPMSAGGEAETSGTAVVTASAAIVAQGQNSTSGAGFFTVRASASTVTTGAAAFSAFAGLIAGGNSSTSGAAALGIGIYASSGTQTLGSAVLTASAMLSASGSCITTGNAVFDGVGPGGGGGRGGDSRYDVAIDVGRRAVR